MPPARGLRQAGPPREATALGVLLNACGLTELVILNVGLGLGVIDTRLFTAMVLMAVVATLMTGPLLHRSARRAHLAPDDRRRGDLRGRPGERRRQGAAEARGHRGLR